MQTQARAPSLHDRFEKYKEDIAERLRRLDKHGSWLKKVIEKNFRGRGPQEIVLTRSAFRSTYANGRLGQPMLVAPLYSESGHGTGGELEGWGKRMGDDFFSDPDTGVRVLQHWIEREDIYPRMLHVVYHQIIDRGFSEKSVRIKSM